MLLDGEETSDQKLVSNPTLRWRTGGLPRPLEAFGLVLLIWGNLVGSAKSD